MGPLEARVSFGRHAVWSLSTGPPLNRSNRPPTERDPRRGIASRSDEQFRQFGMPDLIRLRVTSSVTLLYSANTWSMLQNGSDQ